MIQVWYRLSDGTQVYRVPCRCIDLAGNSALWVKKSMDILTPDCYLIVFNLVKTAQN
jgi:hypothetical protein